LPSKSGNCHYNDITKVLHHSDNEDFGTNQLTPALRPLTKAYFSTKVVPAKKDLSKTSNQAPRKHNRPIVHPITESLWRNSKSEVDLLLVSADSELSPLIHLINPQLLMSLLRQACLILLHFIKTKCAISDDIAGQRRASTSVTSALYICTKAGCISPGAKETVQD
jgi:hypothetical protein